MLVYDVTGLLRSTAGAVRTYPVHGETLPISDDLRLAAPIEGMVRLSRTGRSILVRADLETALEGRCGRCLRPVASPVRVKVEEEALPSVDLESGRLLDVSAEPEAFRLTPTHELDLREPVREAISLAEPIVPLCRPDCRGLCPECGEDLNEMPGHVHPETAIDPRLAGLAGWKPPDEDDRPN